MLTGKGVKRTGYGNKGDGVMRTGYDPRWSHKQDLMSLYILTNNIIKLRWDLMMFIHVILYLKNGGWGIYNKSWWVCWYWHTLDCFVCKCL